MTHQISIPESWFFNGTEGFLGKPEECKILIILKEPDSDNKDATENLFWFKKVFLGKCKGKTYLSPLSQAASHLIPGEKPALAYAAYINLRPEKGDKNTGKDFKKILNRFSEGDADKHRWDIIEGMPENGHIITTKNILFAMKTAIGSECRPGCRLLNDDPGHFIINAIRMPSFAFSVGSKRINVYSVYHPRYLQRKGWKIDSFQP